MMRLFLNGIGLLGPGLNGWSLSHQIFAGERALDNETVKPPVPDILSTNERRRSSETVKLALHVAQEAITHSQIKPQEAATVFASSDGDGFILHQLCSALTEAAPHISPTLFHHSVHNAAAGYWAIAHHSQLPSTSISCHNGTFSGGLLETASQVAVDGLPTLLVAYDIPAPSPLYEARPIPQPFGIALLTQSTHYPQSIVRLEVSLVFHRAEDITIMKDQKLERLRQEIPSARALPLLTAIASNRPATVILEYLEHAQVLVNITPCR